MPLCIGSLQGGGRGNRGRFHIRVGILNETRACVLSTGPTGGDRACPTTLDVRRGSLWCARWDGVRSICRSKCTKKKLRRTDVSRARAPTIPPHTRILTPRTDTLNSLGENFLACPGLNQELVSRGCSRFSAGRKGHGTIRRAGESACRYRVYYKYITLWSTNICIMTDFS
jgi:hypothetical protein